MSNRKAWGPYIFWGFLIFLFTIIASSVSLVAAGYQFDWESKKLTQASLIFLSGRPREATISVNGQAVATRFPLRLPTVIPGTHQLTVEKDGYVTWRKSYNLGPGEARAETDILLFLTRPEVSEVTDPNLIRQVKENTKASSFIFEQEIRLGSRLVTRLSGNLITAQPSANRSHIFFQVDRDIRVVEDDGSNELLLYTLSSLEPSNLLVLENGTEIVFLDGGIVKRLRVS